MIKPIEHITFSAKKEADRHLMAAINIVAQSEYTKPHTLVRQILVDELGRRMRQHGITMSL